jgi:hypothetical protein
MSGKNQWVVPVNGGDQWGVRGEGNDRLTSIHDTQQQAIDRARDIAINQQSEMLIQGRDGQIRERNSYGNDPFPPKGGRGGWSREFAVVLCSCKPASRPFPSAHAQVVDEQRYLRVPRRRSWRRFREKIGRNRNEPGARWRSGDLLVAHAERRGSPRGGRIPQKKTPNRERLGAE